MSQIEEKLDKIISYLELMIKHDKIVPNRNLAITDFENSVELYERFARESGTCNRLGSSCLRNVYRRLFWRKPEISLVYRYNSVFHTRIHLWKDDRK